MSEVTPPTGGTGVEPRPDPAMLAFARRLQEESTRMQMEHQFAVDEVLTKVGILRREFTHLHRYNPIEHVNSRVKTPESILEKALLRGIELTPEAIRAEMTDIAGVRITCSFIADTYRILENLTSQTDIRIITVKDYIARPKPNGYKSLHAIVEIPVFLSTGPVQVIVEVQIRTISMDFWASLEHKIQYKYDGAVPDHLVASLNLAADVADQLDRHMEQLHEEVRGSGSEEDPGTTAASGVFVDNHLLRRLWAASRGVHPSRPEPPATE